jgi:hypothetical protein
VNILNLGLAFGNPLLDVGDCLFGLRADIGIEAVEPGFEHLGTRGHLIETGLSPFNEDADATLYWALLTHGLHLTFWWLCNCGLAIG